MLIHQEPLLGEALHTKDMLDELEETLSLCDLPLYSDDQSGVDEWEEDLSSDSQGSSSMSSSENEYFEFFSEELNPLVSNFPPENIIFCGKLIPYKEASTKDSPKISDSKKQTSTQKKHGWSIFGWNFSSKNGKKSTTHKDHQSSRSLQQSPKNKLKNRSKKGYNCPVQKMSILTSSSSGKARWYLFLFGISRYSTEVELRDIKNRQSRRHCSSPQPRPPPELAFQSQKEKISRLWGLIRVLSCGGNHHPNTMVVASIGCNPRD